MKIYTFDQGTPEWDAIRLGKITGSVMEKIITKTGKRSSQIEDVVNMAVAELLLGYRQESFQSDAMLRGKDLEDQALKYFNYVNDFEFEKVGFVSATDESGLEAGYGVSPDGLWLKKGMGLELKCPMPHTHVAYLRENKLPEKYHPQVQAALMVTGFDKWIFGSYHPSMACLTVEVGRDEKFISAMEPLVKEACHLIKEEYARLTKMEVAS